MCQQDLISDTRPLFRPPAEAIPFRLDDFKNFFGGKFLQFIFIRYFRYCINFNEPCLIYKTSDKNNGYYRKITFISPLFLKHLKSLKWILPMQNMNVEFDNVSKRTSDIQ